MAQVPMAGLSELKEQFDIVYPRTFYFSDSDLRKEIVEAEKL